ncbi:MAG: wax ester/triacylglycerol synthase family O-acyltransferase [Mycobacterium sp.]
MNKSIAPLDLSWLLFETPAGTTHVGAMMLFKKPRGNPAAVREIVDAYRQFRPTPPFNVLPELMGRGAPHFRETDDWDPHYHVGHLSLPTGSSYDDLLRLVSDLHEPMLDRDRLLFRCWIIDGVPGGRFAIYTKTHHSVVDGVSGLRMLYQGLASTDERRIPKPAFALPPSEPEPHEPTPLLHKITDSIKTVVSQAGAVNQISMEMLRKAVSAAVGGDPKGSVPFLAHHAPTNQPLKQGRSFATLSLPLEEMHQIGHLFGGTLNDVAATIVDAGVHAYLAEKGDPFPHRLVAMIPVSLRAEGDTTVGTRVTALFPRLGEPQAAVAQRIEQIVESVQIAKKDVGAWSSDTAMTYGAGLLGLAILGAQTRVDQLTPPACNLVISNVPGIKETRYLNGAELLGIYPISALAASIGLNVTLSSYHDHMDFGFVANTASISDVSALADHTRQAYRELKKAAARSA